MDRPVFNLKVTGPDGWSPPLTWSNRGFAYSMTSSGVLQGTSTYTLDPVSGRGTVDLLYDTVIGIDMVGLPQPNAGEMRAFTLTVFMADGGAECTQTGEIFIR